MQDVYLRAGPGFAEAEVPCQFSQPSVEHAAGEKPFQFNK